MDPRKKRKENRNIVCIVAVDRDNLLDTLDRAQEAVDRRSPWSAGSRIHLNITGSRRRRSVGVIVLDDRFALEFSLASSAGAGTDRVTVDGRELTRFLRALPPGESVTIETHRRPCLLTVAHKQRGAEFHAERYRRPRLFPLAPFREEPRHRVPLPASLFGPAASSCARIARESSDPRLNDVQSVLAAESFRMVACDGYQAATADIDLIRPIDSIRKGGIEAVLLPGEAVEHMARSLAGVEDVEVRIHSDGVVLRAGRVECRTVMTDSSGYPDVELLVPLEPARTTARALAGAVLAALRSMNAPQLQDTVAPIRLTVSGGGLLAQHVHPSRDEDSDAEAVRVPADARTTGARHSVTLNPAFLLSQVEVLPDECVVDLDMHRDALPLVMTTSLANGDIGLRQTYLQMPMVMGSR